MERSGNSRHLERKLREVQAERDAFERDVTVYLQENKQLREQVEILKTSHTTSDSQAVKVLNEIRQHHSQLMDLREQEYGAELKRKDKVFKESIFKRKELEQRLKESDASLGKHEAIVTKLQATLSKLENDKEKMVKQSEKCQTASKNHQVQIDTLEKKISMLNKEVEDKESQIASMKEKFHNEFETAASKNRVRIRVLEDQIKSIKQDCEKKANDLAKVNTRLAGVSCEREAVTSKQQHQLFEADKRFKQSQKNSVEKERLLCEANEKIAVLEAEYEALSTKQRIHVRSLEDKVDKLRKEHAAKDEQLQMASSKLSSAEKTTTVLSSRQKEHLRSMEEQLNQLQHEKDLKEDELIKRSSEIKMLQAKCAGLTTKQQNKQLVMDDQVSSLQTQLETKSEEVDRLASKLSGMENNTKASSLKQTLHVRALETKMKKLEAEGKEKDENIFRMTTELNSHTLEVKSVSTQKHAQVKTLEDKIRKLEAENHSKEEQLYKVSTKLAHSELEGDSVASSYRVRIRALEEKNELLQSENLLKEEQLIQVESKASESEVEVKKMREKFRRMEIELNRKGDELNELRTVENELTSKTSESLSQIQSAQRAKTRLESNLTQLKSELSEASRKILSLECDVADATCGVKRRDRQIEKLKTAESELKGSIADKEAQHEKVQHELISALASNEKIKLDLKKAKQGIKACEAMKEQAVGELEREKSRASELLQTSSQASRQLDLNKTEQKTFAEKQKQTISELQRQLKHSQQQLVEAQNIENHLENECDSLDKEVSRLRSIEVQITEYKGQCDNLQENNSSQSIKLEKVLKENRELQRKFNAHETDQLSRSKNMFELQKTSELLKESCLMLEKQVEELETFNNELIEKQNVLTIERDDSRKKCSSMEVEVRSLQNQMRSELSELDQNSADQMTEIKIQLRNEMNQAHEMSEEFRDLQRRYRLLELNAAGVQRKLNAEKDAHDRCRHELDRSKSDLSIIEQSVARTEQQLHSEIERCDDLEKEKTLMLNDLETDKLAHSHELVRLNCTGAQQIKLIDFLQSRVEELESSDKKKKKNQKKATVYQAPLQYRELQDLLEAEKASNVQLQQQVNLLRSDLQDSNSKVKRMKHGMDTPLSPGSIAAISSLVKSPAPQSCASPNSKTNKLRSKPRMHHNIPHRLSQWLCTRAVRCSVCLAIIHFGHGSLRCSECSITCHTKCSKSVTNTCGLPGGLFQQFKDGPKPSNLSPISCVFKGSSSDQLHGCLKVLCGDDSWTPRVVRLTSTHLRICPPNTKSPTKSDKDDTVDLTKAAYVHTDVSQAELPSTAKQDLPYVFKIQTGSSNSCWPARSIYLLAAGFGEKHQWVDRLEAVTSKHGQPRNEISANSKILGNEILQLMIEDKIEINCSLPVSDKEILFGCDAGLFLLAPNKSSVSSRSNMMQVGGVDNIFHMETLAKNKVVAIEGKRNRLITFDISTIGKDRKVTVHEVGLDSCHVVACGHAEGVHYLCAGSPTSVTVLKYNDRLKKFCKQKEIATTEPCTCMIFTPCSVIIGTNMFYEVDLTDYKIDEFLDVGELALSRRLKDSSIFPVAVLRLSDTDGRQEFLLCFHEFGLFVDGFGRLSRSGHIKWSRMPLSFEYREPYLVVVQFNSVEILQLDPSRDVSADNSAIDHAFLGFPSARYLGPAITDGAVYLGSSDGSRSSVYCCKGNMKGVSREQVKNSQKRRHAVLSSSVDSLASPTVKRSSAFSDVSNLRQSRDLSGSCQSSLDTSHWTTSASEYDGVSIDHTITDSDTLMGSTTDSDTIVPSAGSGPDDSSRLQWRTVLSPGGSRKTAPAKPTRRRDFGLVQGHEYDPVPSTEV